MICIAYVLQAKFADLAERAAVFGADAETLALMDEVRTALVLNECDAKLNARFVGSTFHRS
jgi:hypothetical protein